MLRMATNNVLKRKAVIEAAGVSKKMATGPGHWSEALRTSMSDPTLKVEEDDLVVIIKDKYPKARYHYLIIPKENVPNLKSLTRTHLPLLKHMHDKGKDLISSSGSSLKFRLGYHAVPSLSQLHLHVISEDFDSDCLKTKKHWNSFTNEYFVLSQDLIRLVEEKGCAEFDRQKHLDLLKESLRCHVCRKDMSTMPALKSHIKSHITSD